MLLMVLTWKTFLYSRLTNVFRCPYESISACQHLWNRMFLLHTLEYDTLCWKAEPYNWCDFFVPTFNAFIINHTWTLEKKFIWRKLLFVCYLNCWKLFLHWCTKLKEGTKQLHGSLKQTVCLQLHNSFPFAQSNFQVPRLFHIPRTQWSLNNAVFFEVWFALLTEISEVGSKTHI